MDPAEVEIISVLIESQKVLCLRIASESPLIGQAAHILDGCLAHLQMGSSRMEAEETDVSKQFLPLFREVGVWPEVKNVSLLELEGPEGTRAIGAGSNIKTRRRSAWLAMALALVVSAGRRGHNPHQLTRLLSDWDGLHTLATRAWHVMCNQKPAFNAEASEGAAQEPPSEAGRHSRRQERGPGPHPSGRWRNGQVAEEGIPSGATCTQGVGMASEFHQPEPEPVSMQVSSVLPPTPTWEDNFDFAVGLYPGLVSNATRVLVFNDPMGVEEC
ncbi:unnamed protein product [Symbiodinium sp. CCMP2592]|nr:unnamed protein product [Symbiodinium sp. CCMP2592]